MNERSESSGASSPEPGPRPPEWDAVLQCLYALNATDGSAAHIHSVTDAICALFATQAAEVEALRAALRPFTEASTIGVVTAGGVVTKRVSVSAEDIFRAHKVLSESLTPPPPEMAERDQWEAKCLRAEGCENGHSRHVDICDECHKLCSRLAELEGEEKSDH